jgi:hypothetical protein
MLTHTAIPTFAGSLSIEPLFFARQPEPDLEFTEEDLTDAAPQSSPPMKSPRPSNRRPILWLFLLAILGGLAYIAMDPDMVMRVLEPYLGENETAPARSAPPPQAKQAPAVSPAPPVRTEPATPLSPAGSTPMTQARGPSSAPTPGPLFGEGQKVTAVPDPARPNAPVLLFTDAARTKPGPSVAAGSSLTVLDGELQTFGWIYSVSTEDGREGWVAEKHLKFRR